MQSTMSLNNPGMRTSSSGVPRSSATKSNRNVNIQLVGPQGVGKTHLIEALITEQDPTQLPHFNEGKNNLMSHYTIQIGDKKMKLLDCSGNSRCQHLVKEWFARSIWFFVVYDMSNQQTLDQAIEMAKEVHLAGARIVLLGNRWAVEQGKTVEANVMTAKVLLLDVKAWASPSKAPH